MIEIYQRKVTDSELSTNLTKLDEMSVAIDKDLINKDLQMLKLFRSKSNNTINNRNIKTLEEYLHKLLKSINDESKLELCWTSSKSRELPYTYPISLINEPVYNIDSSSYVILDENEKLVEVGLSRLCDLIAFEFMYKDFGESHETIEDLLSECNLISLYDSSIFDDLLIDCSPDRSMYEAAQFMRIEDCAYKHLEEKKVSDYFYSAKFDAERYKEVVNYSCNYAAFIIANSIIKNYLKTVDSYKVLMVTPTVISFVVKTDKEIDPSNIVETISIRLFGRKFKVQPNISIV